MLPTAQGSHQSRVLDAYSQILDAPPDRLDQEDPKAVVITLPVSRETHRRTGQVLAGTAKWLASDQAFRCRAGTGLFHVKQRIGCSGGLGRVTDRWPILGAVREARGDLIAEFEVAEFEVAELRCWELLPTLA